MESGGTHREVEMVETQKGGSEVGFYPLWCLCHTSLAG